MATTKKPAGATQVEAIVHGEKRSNIPTADAQDFVGDDVQAVQQLRWPRDPSLDPQLVLKGKDADADELVADAPPIYIQEKIDRWSREMRPDGAARPTPHFDPSR